MTVKLHRGELDAITKQDCFADFWPSVLNLQHSQAGRDGVEAGEIVIHVGSSRCRIAACSFARSRSSLRRYRAATSAGTYLRIASRQSWRPNLGHHYERRIRQRGEVLFYCFTSVIPTPFSRRRSGCPGPPCTSDVADVDGAGPDLSGGGRRLGGAGAGLRAQ